MSVLFPGLTLTVTPKTGSYVNGKWVVGAPGGQKQISGTLQNAPDYILQTLPEGKRDQGAQLLITDATLVMSDPIAGTIGDLIEIDGEQWQVTQRTNWNNGIIPNNEYLLLRMKEGT